MLEQHRPSTSQSSQLHRRQPRGQSACHQQSHVVTEALALPPLPKELRHLVNPFLDPRGAIDVLRQQTRRVGAEAIAAATERLSKPTPSRAQETYQQNMDEVLGLKKRPSTRPCSRSRSRNQSSPPTLETLAERYFSGPLAAKVQHKFLLERKHVAPVGGFGGGKLMTNHQLAEFIERNVSRPASRAESRQSVHRASVSGLQRKSSPRRDHTEHFYTQQLLHSKQEMDRVMHLYAAAPQSRPLSPQDQRSSVERLYSAGRK
jgi:hypothetical protein